MNLFLKLCRSAFLFVLVLEISLTALKSQDAKASFFHPAVSVQGTVAFDSNLEGKPAVFIISENGSFSRISPPEVLSSHPAWSKDGRFLSYESFREGNVDIYVYDIQTKKEHRLTDSDSADDISKWGVGNEVLFASNRSGAVRIYEKRFESSEDPVMLTTKLDRVIYPVPSPDGEMILFSTVFDGDVELMVADRQFNDVRRLTYSKGYDAWGSWSSDGKTIVFTSGRSGSNEIYLINVDGSGLKQITHNTENSAMPSFSVDGSSVIFMSRQNGAPSKIYQINLETKVQKVLTK